MATPALCLKIQEKLVSCCKDVVRPLSGTLGRGEGRQFWPLSMIWAARQSSQGRVLDLVRRLRRVSSKESTSAFEVSEPPPPRKKRQGLAHLYLGPTTGTPAATLIPRLIAISTHAKAALVWRPPRPISEQFYPIARLAAKPSDLKPQHSFPPASQDSGTTFGTAFMWGVPLASPSCMWLRPHHQDGAGRILQDHVRHVP